MIVARDAAQPASSRGDDQRMRILDRLEQLYAIGGGVGANRPGYSAAEDEAHGLAAGWMREAGLEVEVDGAGNLIGRSGDARIWTGSHLDSVPNGGKFDGALGVVAGIEAVERAGTGAVVAFREEETGCGGSRAFVEAGALPACFLELHIEQGPVLERAGVPLGLVTGITGMVRGERVFEGKAGHAGTVPMDGRRDALVEAAEYVLRARDAAVAIEAAVATVGELEVEPGAGNVIPSRVRLSVDVRAPDRERLDRLAAELEVEPLFRLEPVAMDEEPRGALRSELEARGLALVELNSGAGHDAAILAAAGVPTAMLFVRSLNGGISHAPEELSSPEDIALAVELLAGALARLASMRRSAPTV
jgi:acetylornithine deacetylase/succinyl-diaminopimelate desuccinylase-like protein